MKKQKYLLVESYKTPRFWLTDEVPDNRFLLGGIEYTDSNSGDFIGFYDNFRNSAGEIFGIRY